MEKRVKPKSKKSSRAGGVFRKKKPPPGGGALEMGRVELPSESVMRIRLHVYPCEAVVGKRCQHGKRLFRIPGERPLRRPDAAEGKSLFVTEGVRLGTASHALRLTRAYAARASAKEASTTSSFLFGRIAVIFSSVWGTLTPTCDMRVSTVVKTGASPLVLRNYTGKRGGSQEEGGKKKTRWLFGGNAAGFWPARPGSHFLARKRRKTVQASAFSARMEA